jgi:hypothetical protein
MHDSSRGANESRANCGDVSRVLHSRFVKNDFETYAEDICRDKKLKTHKCMYRTPVGKTS